MKKIDSSDFKSMVEKAINSGKDSISFQIYGYNNQWVCDMVDGLGYGNGKYHFNYVRPVLI